MHPDYITPNTYNGYNPTLVQHRQDYLHDKLDVFRLSTIHQQILSYRHHLTIYHTTTNDTTREDSNLSLIALEELLPPNIIGTVRGSILWDIRRKEQIQTT